MVLGYNEFMAVLRSPIFFSIAATAVVIVAGAFWTGNMQTLYHTGRMMMSFGLRMLVPMMTKIAEQAGGGRPAQHARDIDVGNTPTTTAT